MLIKHSQPAPQLKAYQRKLAAGEKLAPMGELVASGQVRSYTQEGDTVTIFADSPAVIDRLPIVKQPRFDLKQKVVGFVKPDQLARDCAPEYATWRKWNLATSVLAGVMGFMATSVFLDSQNASYSNSEAIALSGVVTGTLGKVTQMCASPLAKMGDSDPKQSYLRSQLMATGTSIAGLGLLAAIPTGHLPVFCATSVLGTVGGTIGSAAGANIFSHLVPGPSKGDVVTKDSNQELLASLWGMPVGLALSRVAKGMGMKAGVLAACLLGPVKAYCHLQAARALRMAPAGREQMEALSANYLTQDKFQEAPQDSLVDTLKGVFRRDPLGKGGQTRFVNDLKLAAGDNPEITFDLFAKESYLLSLDKDNQPVVALQSGSRSEDALRASMHAELLRRAVDSGLPTALADMGRNVNEELIRLTKRALPDKGSTAASLARSGWHLSMNNLGIPTVTGCWGETAKNPQETTPIELPTLRRLLVARPDRAELAKLLG